MLTTTRIEVRGREDVDDWDDDDNDDDDLLSGGRTISRHVAQQGHTRSSAREVAPTSTHTG